MSTCIAIRHVAFEDLGSFASVIRGAGHDIRYVDAATDDLSAPDIADADLLAVLGGPIGVYEEEAYPFLTDELRLLERRLKGERPTFGICLGAQLIARALGSRVFPNPKGKEIGWSTLEFTPQGEGTPIGGLAGVPVLHWHGDTFDLPDGATLLCSTPVTENQAFTHGAHILGLQFHPEVTARGLERWFVGHAAELAGAGISVPRLRTEGARFAPGLEEAGSAVFADLLRAVA